MFLVAFDQGQGTRRITHFFVSGLKGHDFQRASVVKPMATFTLITISDDPYEFLLAVSESFLN